MFEFTEIAVVESPFREKFGIPRQSGLVPEIQASIRLLPPYSDPAAVRELSQYSHIWLQFVFHKAQRQSWQPTVRPPRLGGNTRVGVFATRSPFRPNPIGLSVARLEQVVIEHGQSRLLVSGIDLMDGTPVLDIKPYVAYSDSIPGATCGFASEPPTARLPVVFSPEAHQQLTLRQNAEQLRSAIVGVLGLDPRPAYVEEDPQRVYGMCFYDFDLQWRVQDGQVEVLALAEK